MIYECNKKKLIQNTKVVWLFVVIFLGSFLFGGNSLAVVHDYNKSVNGTLEAAEWNLLPTDFVNTWATSTMVGPLGIGTATPNTKLHIYGLGGMLKLQGSGATGNNYLQFTNSTDSSLGFLGYGSGSSNELYIAQQSAANINFYNGGTTKAVINTAGNLGIGTTTPNNLFQVYGGTGQVVSVSGGQIGGLNSTPINSDQAVPLGYLQANYLSSAPGSSAGWLVNGNTLANDTSWLGSISNYDIAFKTNNTERMRILKGGNVGIGTTAPSRLLDIYQDYVGQTGLRIYNPHTVSNGGAQIELARGAAYRPAQIVFQTNATNEWYVGELYNAGTDNTKFSIATSSDFSNSKFVVQSDGNVGIGTTAPDYPLVVYKDTTGNATLQVRNPNITNGSGASIRLYSSGNGNMPAEIINKPDATGGSLVFNLRKADSTYNDVVTFQGGGNVGIGTTNPNFPLTINSATGHIFNTYGVTTGGQYLNITSTGANLTIGTEGLTPGTVFSSNGLSYASGITTSNTTALQLGTNNAANVTILNGGNVGIGTTTPNNLFQIYGGTGQVVNVSGGQIGGLNSTPLNADQAVPLGYLQANYLSSAPSSSAGWLLTGNSVASDASWLGSIGNYDISFKTNSTERMRILKGGNVGIGTANPGKLLEIAETGAFGLVNDRLRSWYNRNTAGYIYDSNYTDYSGMIMSNVDLSLASSKATGGNIRFYTHNGTSVGQRMTIDSTGNVGIGTTGPGQVLDVNGNILSNGTIQGNRLFTGSIGAVANYLYVQHQMTDATALAYLYATYSGTGSGQGSVLDVFSSRGGASDFYLANFRNYSGSVMYIRGDGNIGIGTTTPTNLLHVNAGTGQAMTVAGGQIGGLNSTPINADQAVPLGYLQSNYAPIGTGAGAAFVQGGNSFGATATLGTNDNNALNFETNNGTKMTILAGGNVGIGTTNPVAKLDTNFGAVPNDVRTRGVLQEFYGNTNWFKGNPMMIAGGTAASPISVDSSSIGNLGLPIFYDGSVWRPGATIASAVSSVSASTNVGSELRFYTGTSTGDASSGTFTGVIQQMVVDKTGNVGIGTATPGSKLTVSGGHIAIDDTYALLWGSGGTKIIGSDGGDYMAFSVAGENMRINSSGNVGIGTTNPTVLMQVGGVAASAAPAQLLFGNYKNTGSGRPVFLGNWASPGLWGIGPASSVADYTLQIGQVGAVNSDFGAGALNLVVTGNIGIGTTMPNTKLQVYGGTGQVVNVSGGQIGGLASVPLNADQAVPLGYLQANYSPTSGNLWSGTLNGSIYNGTAGAGNVGIGTNSPSSKLTIRATSTDRVIIGSDVTDTNADSPKLSFFGGSAASITGPSIQKINEASFGRGGLAFFTHAGADYTSESEVMRINYSGSVGIGTTNPAAKLDIIGPDTDNTNIIRIVSNSGTRGSFAIRNGVGINPSFLIGTQSSSETLGIMTAGTEKVRIDALGNVGIGATNPQYKLSLGATNDKIGFYQDATHNASIELYNSSNANMNFLTTNQAGGSFTFMGTGGTGGNVGIGTTNPTIGKLQVDGSNQAIINANATSGYGSFLLSAAGVDKLHIGYAAVASNYGAQTAIGDVSIKSNNTNIHFVTGAGNANTSMYISNAGNVGIGTTTPNNLFQVYGGTGQVMSVSGGQIGGLNSTPINADQAVPLGYLQANYSPTSGNLWSGTLNGTIYNGTAGAGNVGIGTTAPGTKAEIQRIETAVRTTYNDILTITANATTNPYNGHGGGILFKGTTYQSGTGNVNYARIGSTINSNSVSTAGSNLFFDVAPLSDGVLARAMTINYNGNVSIPLGTLTVSGTGISSIAGNVGIGTTGPVNRLELFGGNAAVYNYGANASLFIGDNAATRATINYISSNNNLSIQSYTGANLLLQPTSGNVGIGTTDPGLFKLKVAGDVGITGTLQTQMGADFAEEFATTDILEPGTVVVMDDHGYKSVRPCTQSYDKTVVGIVSNNPSIIAGRIESEHKAIIAMMGVVKVKVISSNGTISKGDLLTSSSHNGYAMKAVNNKQGTIIGKALENLNSYQGEINVLVNLQ